MEYRRNNIIGALNGLIERNHLEQAADHINDTALLASHEWGFTAMPDSRLAYAELNSIGLRQTLHIHVDGNEAFFNAIFDCEFTLHAVNGAEPETSEDWALLSVPGTITFDEHGYELTFSEIHRYYDAVSDKANKNYMPHFQGIPAAQNLIPSLSGSEEEMNRKREAEAEWFLKNYCPEALATVMPVPIRRIAEQELGMKFIMDRELSEDFSTLGEVVFETCEVMTRRTDTGKKELIVLSKGTVVVDSDIFWYRGYGSVNFTIAHEVYHWLRHRAHHSLMKYVPKPEDYLHQKEIMEIQAKQFADRVLMPAHAVKKLYAGLITEYKDAAEVDAYEMIVNRLAQFFSVSHITARIRLDQLGLHEYSHRVPAIRRLISFAEIFELYVENRDFRNLLDSGEYRYRNGYVVKNDPLYIDDDELTSYALFHLKECTLTFREKKETVSDDSLGPGLKSYQKFSLTLDLEQRKKNDLKKYEEDAKILSAAFEKYRLSEEKVTFCRFIFPIIYDADTEELKPQILSPELLEQYGPPPEPKTRKGGHRSGTRLDFVAGRYITITEPQLFESKTLMQRRLFAEIKNGKKNTPEVKTVVAICAGYHLDYDTLVEALGYAGHYLLNVPEHLAYKFLFRFCYDQFEDTDTFNTLLCMIGQRPIGTESYGT